MDNDEKEHYRELGAGFIRDLFAPPDGLIDWRGPNWATVAFLGLLLWVSQLPVRKVYLGFISHDQIAATLSSLIGLAINRITGMYASRVKAFVPRTVLEAKRANEQIKSLATAINAVAAGGAVAMMIKQLGGADPDYGLVVLAVALAFWIHTGARHLLGLLKDENEPASIPEA
jgi:hypothetical protein